MNCDPNALIEAAKCFRCLPPGMTREMLVYLLCQWANSTACTLPTAPVDLGVTAGDSQNTLNWPAGVGATGYNIKRSLVPGGPYTVIGTSAASPYVDHTAVNYTTYYYVVSSTNACGESAGNSVESHGRPFIPFSYVPATAIIGWNDANGAGHSGNLAFFNATADFASVTDIGLATQGLTSISNLQALPLLATIDVTFNSLTTLDVSGMTHLWYVGCYGNFGMTTLNVTGCTGLTTLASTFCALITVDISTCPLLIYVALQNNSLPVLVVNTVLTQLVAFGHTGGTVTLIGQTPAAPPSVGPPNGIAAKAALLAEVPAWTVTTD
jgi:hypothetical protein